VSPAFNTRALRACARIVGQDRPLSEIVRLLTKRKIPTIHRRKLPVASTTLPLMKLSAAEQIGAHRVRSRRFDRPPRAWRAQR
jgi:hypothetical protein